MFICTYQNILHASVPVTPTTYPIVVKPIINLYGMGIDSSKINNTDEYKQIWNSTLFWMEYFEGIIQSWDIVIRNGEIIYHTFWTGYIVSKNSMGKFDYWEWDGQNSIKLEKNKEYLSHIKKFVNDNLKRFTGTLNVEIISNKIIEAHLRMGDIDQLPYDIVYATVLNTVNPNPKSNSYIKNLFTKTYNNIYEPLYLIPIWQQIKLDTNLNEIYTYLKDVWEDIIIKDINITFYYFDKPQYSTPLNWKRWFLLRTTNFDHVMTLRKQIEEDLINKF